MGWFGLVVGMLLATSTIAGCATQDAGSLQMRVTALQQEQAQRQYELQQISAQIAAARQELAKQQCLAFEASVASEVAMQAAACISARATFAECEANNHAHTANSSILGCIAGLGASVASGGAAAPLIALGCGGGAILGHASGSECGADPACTLDQTILGREALQRRGLTALPACQ